MLEETTASTGGFSRGWRMGAFVTPAVTQQEARGLLLPQQQQQRQRLKSRRRRVSDNPLPLPLSCSTLSGPAPSGQRGTATSQYFGLRDRSRRPAARVVAGANTPRNSLRSLSSAAPQTLTDPSKSTAVRCKAGEMPRCKAGAPGVDFGGGGGGDGGASSSGRSSSSMFGDAGHQGTFDGGGGNDVSGASEAEHEEEGQGVFNEDGGMNGAEEGGLAGGVELGAGVDEESRQLIGRLNKLARSGLWKASFKVLRVEQALHARKVAAAREKGQEYSSSSWRMMEPKAYNAILAALSRAGKWEEAVLLFKEMETRGIPRDAVSYACLITACGRGLQWKKALSLLQEMRDAGLQPNSFVYSAAIDACAKGRQWQKALSLLQEMEVVDGLSSNLICYNAAADACGKAGRPVEALALVSKMRDVGMKPNEVSYLSVISACSRLGDWRQAMWLLDEMVAFGLQPDLKCYCSAITACGRGGKWRQALDLLDVMHRNGPPPNDYCYNAAISACGKSGQWHRAKELLSTMREKGVPPDLISYNSAIDACGKGGRWQEGLKMFVDMVKASEEPWDPEMDHPKPPTPDATTYGAAITACSRGGQWQIALRFLDDMEKKGVERTEGVFQATLAGCARIGRWKECIVTLDQMQKSGFRPRVAAYNSVITACGRGGQWQRAVAILQQMSARGATPDVITLNAAMAACTQSKRWRQAKAILDFMRDPDNVPTTLCGGLPFPIIDVNGATDDQHLADVHFTPSGRMKAEEINGGGGKCGEDATGVVGVGVVAMAEEFTGSVNGGVNIAVNGGGGVGRSVGADAPSAVTGLSAVDVSTRSGRSDGSDLARRRARAGGSSWPPRPDAFSYHTVIKALATAGMWHDAVDLLQDMADERRRSLQPDEGGVLETAVGGAERGGRQWPINVDRFRSIFQLELKNNEIVGHERGWSGGLSTLSPEVALRANAMDVLMVMEREEKEARLSRQAVYENSSYR